MRLRKVLLWSACLAFNLCACQRLLPQGQRSSLSHSSVQSTSGSHQLFRGPTFSHKHLPIKDEPAQLIWLTAFGSRLVSEEPLLGDAFGMVSLDITNLERHNFLFGKTRSNSNRLFTLYPGHQEIQLPDGLGIPLLSNEPCRVNTQTKSQDPENASEVRFENRLDFSYDRGLEESPRAVTCIPLLAMRREDGKNIDFNGSRLRSPEILELSSEAPLLEDSKGQAFNPFLLVPPGVQDIRTGVSGLMTLDEKAQVHFATVFFSSTVAGMEFWDNTDNLKILDLRVGNNDFREQGTPTLKPDHDYELRLKVNNASHKPQECYAFANFYVDDPQFNRERLAPRH